MKHTWLDAPFFNIIDQFFGMQSYFLGQCWAIAQIIMILCLCLAAFKYAVNGSGLKDAVVKLAVAFIVFTIVINAYPKIIKGMSDITYEWANKSSYEGSGVSGMLGEVRGNSAFWMKKAGIGNSKTDRKSSIIEVRYKNGKNPDSIMLDLFDKEERFISPNAVIRIIMLIFEDILQVIFKYDIFHLGDILINLLVAIAVLLCGLIGGLQYFICALEFALVTSAGAIMLPFMLWDGTKFLSEKLIGALAGFFVKMLFCTITLLFSIYGYLGMLVQQYDGTTEQIVYVVFSSLCYLMLCMSGPQLAASLLTGTPSLGMGDALKAAATGGAAVAAVARGGAKTAARGAGAAARAKGAWDGAKESGGGLGARAGAAAKSVGHSAATGMRSGAHELGRSLLSSGRGGGGSGSGGGNPPRNRFSQMEKLNAPNASGERKTMGEFLKEQYNEGKGAGGGGAGADDGGADRQAQLSNPQGLPPGGGGMRLTGANAPQRSLPGANEPRFLGAREHLLLEDKR